MALVATPGAANANSYLTLVEAVAYFAERLYVDAWDGAAPTDQEKALIMATRLIDVGVCFIGAATTSTQSLAWPRTGMVNRNGFAIASNSIPQELKNATAELALLLLSVDRTLPNDTIEQGIKRVKAGPIEVEFKDGAVAAAAIPDTVLGLFPSGWLCPSDEELSNRVELEVL